MDIRKAFAPLKRIELGLSDLYGWYSERFSSDQAAAFLFKRLSLDEKAHAALLDYERDLVRKNPKEFSDVDLDFDELAAIADSVESIRTHDCPDVKSAVLVALEFESSAAQVHYKNAIKQANPAIAKLFDSLGKSDKQHLAEIQEFARARNFMAESP